MLSFPASPSAPAASVVAPGFRTRVLSATDPRVPGLGVTGVVFANPWLRVHNDPVLHPSGKVGTYFRVTLGGAWIDPEEQGASVLPLRPRAGDGRILAAMVHQWRHPAQGWTLELPRGRRDPGDVTPLVTARRELAEETGLGEPDLLVALGTVNPDSGILAVRNGCFLGLYLTPLETARGTRTTEGDLGEQDEGISTADWRPLAELGRATTVPAAARAAAQAAGHDEPIGALDGMSLAMIGLAQVSGALQTVEAVVRAARTGRLRPAGRYRIRCASPEAAARLVVSLPDARFTAGSGPATAGPLARLDADLTGPQATWCAHHPDVVAIVAPRPAGAPRAVARR